MSGKRIFVALASAALSFGVFAGTAVALQGNSFSGSGGGGGAGGEVLPLREEAPATTTTTVKEVLGETITAPSAGPELALTEPAESAPSGTLPFTGADIVELSAIGLGALGVGTIMLRRSRVRHVLS